MRRIVKLFPMDFIPAEGATEHRVTFDAPSRLVSVRAFSPYEVQCFRVERLAVDGQDLFLYDLPAQLFARPEGFDLVGGRYDVPPIREGGEVFVRLRNISLAQARVEVLAEVEDLRLPSVGVLSYAELIRACQNVGYDLTCGRCAAIFYTGCAESEAHDGTCETTLERGDRAEDATHERSRVGRVGELLIEVRKVSESLWFAAPEGRAAHHARAAELLNELAVALGLVRGPDHPERPR